MKYHEDQHDKAIVTQRIGNFLFFSFSQPDRYNTFKLKQKIKLRI